jgi:hypothetical protein
MSNKTISMYALIAAQLLFYSSLSLSDNLLPTLCKSNEIAFLNSKLYKVKRDGLVDKNTEKILSLCADKEKEPFGKFIYRYGTIGNVEMEQIATDANKFGLSQQTDSDAHAGEISISFSKEKYNYVVKEGMGMNSSGIRLSVYKSGENILNLSHDTYNDYESRLVQINFDKPTSPIFKLVKPVEPW